MEQQHSLFSDLEIREMKLGRSRPANWMEMSPAQLRAWKRRIFKYQTQIQEGGPTQQGTLFDLAPSPNPDSIDPFSLCQLNTEFWRNDFDDEGIAALYFVIDQELPVLLYIGETSKSNQRWKGEHDCKTYLHNYVATHRIHHLPVRVTTSFWRDAPADYTMRQRLEQALIQKWKAPFNRESWKHWGAPFRDLTQR